MAKNTKSSIKDKDKSLPRNDKNNSDTNKKSLIINKSAPKKYLRQTRRNKADTILKETEIRNEIIRQSNTSSKKSVLQGTQNNKNKSFQQESNRTTNKVKQKHNPSLDNRDKSASDKTSYSKTIRKSRKNTRASVNCKIKNLNKNSNLKEQLLSNAKEDQNKNSVQNNDLHKSHSDNVKQTKNIATKSAKNIETEVELSNPKTKIKEPNIKSKRKINTIKKKIKSVSKKLQIDSVNTSNVENKSEKIRPNRIKAISNKNLLQHNRNNINESTSIDKSKKNSANNNNLSCSIEQVQESSENMRNNKQRSLSSSVTHPTHKVIDDSSMTILNNMQTHYQINSLKSNEVKSPESNLKNNIKKTPVYKKALNKSQQFNKRITRQTNHLYDLDISNEPIKAFKKTRAGFKLKKTTKPRALRKNMMLKTLKATIANEKENLSEQKIKKVVEKVPSSKIVKDINYACIVHVNRLDENVVHKKNTDNLEIDRNLEDFGDNFEADTEQYEEPELDKSIENLDECSDVWPCISTPLPNKLLRNHSKAINFGSPIMKASNIENIPSKSPWRVITSETNRLPLNFPVKSTYLPTYQKDTSLRFSNLNTTVDSLPIKQVSPVKLFNEDFVSHLTYNKNRSATSLFNIQEKTKESGEKLKISGSLSIINNNGISFDNKVSNKENSCSRNNFSNDENMSLGDQSLNKENSILTFVNKDKRQNNISNLFGFASGSESILQERNDNLPKTTRVSLKEIQNIMRNTRKRKQPAEAENSNSMIKKLKSAEEQGEIIEAVEPEKNLENPTLESNECSETHSDRLLNLFEDPEELELSVNLNKDLQYYEPKLVKKSKNLKKFDANSPKKKKACKLSTEEWVASKKWERDFNAMVAEVESFEMIIE